MGVEVRAVSHPNLGRRIFRRTVRIATALVVLLLVCMVAKVLWVRVYATDAARLLHNRESEDLLARRAYLVDKLRDGAFHPSRMPGYLDAQFKGEWALGTCSMTAAALTNLAFQFPETRPSSVPLLRDLVNLALCPGLRGFDHSRWGEDPITSLEGPKGHIGYLGHLNMLLAAHRIAGGTDEFDTLHRRINLALARRVEEARFPYIETYPGEIYTSDNVVVAASLRLFDQVSRSDHGALCRRWLAYTREYLLDPRTGLVVFGVDALGRPLGPSRGSGVGWNSFYLPFVDREFADEQYRLAVRHLAESLPIAMKGLREFPEGVSGTADVDSGPVVLGLSTSGTGFIIAGARHAEDLEMLNGMLLTAEAVGSTIQTKGRRRYLLAPLVGEAIMLAMKTAQLWDNRYLRVK
ncbi:MAG: hypothetical protein AB1646_26140 [Thermodesulfobacteriota bacterium]